MARPRRSSSISLSDIQSALQRHRSGYAGLQAKVDKIGRLMAAVEAEVATLGAGGKRRGRPPGSGRKAKAAAKPARARRGRPTGAGRRAKGEDLNTFLAKVLSGSSKPMGIADIASGAKKLGYKSSSPSFAKIVGMRLGGSKQFKRAGRGLYAIAK